MTNILLFLCLCLAINSYRLDATLTISRAEDEEIERHLKLINKPPIRSFQTKLGDTVDCVDIHKQPAFDHPLLKNHKLQRMPTFLKRREHALPNRTLEFAFEKVSCPKGSVPIRRTTKEDLNRMKSLIAHSLTQSFPGSHFAALIMNKNKNYTGVNGVINVYKPRVKKYQMSLAQIAVQNGEFDGINTILAGWQVSPEIYHNKLTHFFILWTSDSFRTTGCYNTICPGFVQVDRDSKYCVGVPVSNLSSYEGPQFELPFSISQDPESKNWWLIVKNKHVGYFPAALFSNLSVANMVGWGGRVSGVMKGASPPMGSGHFPDGDMTHACYVRRISYVKSGSTQEPDKNLPNIVVDNPDCYDLKYFGFRDDQNRYTLQFGGPGGYCGGI